MPSVSPEASLASARRASAMNHSPVAATGIVNDSGASVGARKSAVVDGQKFSSFFAFGAMMCLLTIVLLVFPGTKLDSLWNLNPDARVAFQSLESWSVLLMLAVGTGCALAAIGLWYGKLWGVPLAIAILFINIIGDLVNVVTRHDYRSLVGLPIAGAMIFYLVWSTSRCRTH